MIFIYVEREYDTYIFLCELILLMGVTSKTYMLHTPEIHFYHAEITATSGLVVVVSLRRIGAGGALYVERRIGARGARYVCNWLLNRLR
jgi:hypothetical protein